MATSFICRVGDSRRYDNAEHSSSWQWWKLISGSAFHDKRSHKAQLTTKTNDIAPVALEGTLNTPQTDNIKEMPDGGIKPKMVSEVCWLQLNVAFHWEAMESKVFLEWTDYKWVKLTWHPWQQAAHDLPISGPSKHKAEDRSGPMAATSGRRRPRGGPVPYVITGIYIQHQNTDVGNLSLLKYRKVIISPLCRI